MKNTRHNFLTLMILLVAFSCSNIDNSEKVPHLELAVKDSRMVQINYYGPGKCNYSHGHDFFSFKIGSLVGKRWIEGSGEFNWDQGNKATLNMSFTASKPLVIRILGFSKESSCDDPSQVYESLSFEKGKHKISLQLYCYYVYDFMKN